MTLGEIDIDAAERLQRVLAARGVASRRHAEAMIKAGRVAVDGRVVTELGTKVDPRAAAITVDGRPLPRPRPRYVLLNKPSGYITTTDDERGRWTVMDLVPMRERIYPVGRLDRDTEGLLLLTNDGDVAHRVMHPRFQLAKEYHVVTSTRPDEATLRRGRAGVTIDGRRVVPDEFRILRENRQGVTLTIVIHEGLYHVVRRLMEILRIPIVSLARVRLGPLTIAGIPVGGWRELTPGERSTLFEALHLQDDPAREGRSTTAARTGGNVFQQRPRRSGSPRRGSGLEGGQSGESHDRKPAAGAPPGGRRVPARDDPRRPTTPTAAPDRPNRSKRGQPEGTPSRRPRPAAADGQATRPPTSSARTAAGPRPQEKTSRSPSGPKRAKSGDRPRGTASPDPMGKGTTRRRAGSPGVRTRGRAPGHRGAAPGKAGAKPAPRTPGVAHPVTGEIERSRQPVRPESSKARKKDRRRDNRRHGDSPPSATDTANEG